MQILPNNKISIKVIFEDEDIIIIDKPAGIPCLPLKEGETGTIANGIVARHVAQDSFAPPNGWVSPANIGRSEDLRYLSEVGILHRLDNDTSGCLLVAKNVEAYQNLRAQFDEGKILKQYTALVLGETPSEGIIETPIIHDPKDKKRMKTFSLRASEASREARMGVLDPPPTADRSNNKLQAALTNYRLIKKFLGERYSLLEITIKTGVRHQIRVHLASIGHPIVGDRLYQNARQRARDRTGLKRQFLHASKIGLPPLSHLWSVILHSRGVKAVEWVEFESPLPDDLWNVLTSLGL